MAIHLERPVLSCEASGPRPGNRDARSGWSLIETNKLFSITWRGRLAERGGGGKGAAGGVWRRREGGVLFPLPPPLSHCFSSKENNLYVLSVQELHVRAE